MEYFMPKAFPKKCRDLVLALLGWDPCDDCGPSEEATGHEEGASCGCASSEPATAQAGVACCGEGSAPVSPDAATEAPIPVDGPYTIRAATPDDLRTVRRLLTRCSLPVQGLEDQFGSQYAVAVSDRSSAIVGVAGYEIHGQYGLLRSVAADPAWQGRGIGSKLVRNRVRDAHDAHGIEELYALTTDAADFFQRLGFAPIDRAGVPDEIRASEEFREVCPSSSTALRRRARNEPGSRDGMAS